MSLLDVKVLRKKKVDKDLNVKVSQNEASERIFVEFSSKDGKLVVQRSFQDTYLGRKDAAAFEESFKSFDDFRAHFVEKGVV
jgi:hypothetical protein